MSFLQSMTDTVRLCSCKYSVILLWMLMDGFIVAWQGATGSEIWRNYPLRQANAGIINNFSKHSHSDKELTQDLSSQCLEHYARQRNPESLFLSSQTLDSQPQRVINLCVDFNYNNRVVPWMGGLSWYIAFKIADGLKNICCDRPNQ